MVDKTLQKLEEKTLQLSRLRSASFIMNPEAKKVDEPKTPDLKTKRPLTQDMK